MKVQEVLLRAMAKKISWWQAAEIIGVSARTMRRWRERLEERGDKTVIHAARGRTSNRKIAGEKRQKAIEILSRGMCTAVLGRP